MAKSTQPPVATSKPTKSTKNVKKDLKNKDEEQMPQGAITADQHSVIIEKPAEPIPVTKSKAELSDDNLEISIEKKLMTLYSLQQIESQIDKIRIIRG